MEIEQLNSVMRDMFTNLINNGYNKTSIAEVTLGKTFVPQFCKYVNNTNLGLIPLERMIKNLGFELHLVPIKSNDNEFNTLLDTQLLNFLTICKNDLIDYLDNRPIRQNTDSKTFEDEIDNMINELEHDVY